MTVRHTPQLMAKIKPEEISNIIRQQIEQYTQEINVASVGTVLQVVRITVHHYWDIHLIGRLRANFLIMYSRVLVYP